MMFKDKELRKEIEQVKHTITSVSVKLDALIAGLGAQDAMKRGRAMLNPYGFVVPGTVFPLKHLEDVTRDFNALLKHLNVEFENLPAERVLTVKETEQ